MNQATERIDCDIAIIGAGIAGVGLAAHLPAGLRAVVIEAETRPGYHSTGRSAAIFIRNYGNAVIRALTRASVPLYENTDRSLFPYPLLTPRGLMYVADHPGLTEHASLMETAEGLHEISVDEAMERVPILRRERIAAAAFEPDAQDIDVDALHQGWIRLAQSRGARLLPNARLQRIEKSGGKWLLQAGDLQVSAGVIANASGAWADEVAALAGLPRLGLQPMRRSMAVLPAPEGYTVDDWPMTADSAEGYYFKPEAGRLFVSPADEVPVDPHDAYVDDMILAEGLDRFEQAVTVPVTRVERSWAGLRTFAPDRSPVAGFDPAEKGFFWLAGQGGYGIQTAPAMSALAAALVSGESPPAGLEEIAEALSPARFDDRIEGDRK